MADIDDLQYLAGWCGAAAGDMIVDRARFDRACIALERAIAARAAPLTVEEAERIKACIDAGQDEGAIADDEAPSLRAAVDRVTDLATGPAAESRTMAGDVILEVNARACGGWKSAQVTRSRVPRDP